MNNKPAFPIQTRDNHEKFNNADMGLTKREYIAALCLQGILGNHDLIQDFSVIDTLIDRAVKSADSLLKRLETE